MANITGIPHSIQGEQKKLELSRGRRLGKYRLEKRLGTGGFCEVWKANDTVEGIPVALKIPLIHNGKRDNRAILREVRLVAQLRHPHILPLKNADIIDGYAILATDISVGTLDGRSRPMAVRRLLSIISQVLQGLSHAHQNRVVHCDVTPGNIFLFPEGRAALGDFGIGLQMKRHMATVDEFGTPGYVAPEQAYGHPTYSSDCFSVGLILFEYITGNLPRWPFRWPIRGINRLQEKTNSTMVRFMKQALAVDPAHRFKHAEQMLFALHEAMPKIFQNGLSLKMSARKVSSWKQLRRDAYHKRYGKIFPMMHKCRDCHESIAESMSYCPWCSSSKNRFDSNSRFNLICPDCHKGVLPEWQYCPWCYGPGFASTIEHRTKGIRYHDHCKYCEEKLLRFMRYCPWCHRKVTQKWQVSPFPETCTRCGWSVDSAFWNYCPWCQNLLAP